MITGKLYSDYPVQLYNLRVIVDTDKNNESTYSFNKKFVDITPEPVIIKSFKDVDRWYDDPMLYYFQQYKFALYCATALCGVSKDRLTRGLDLTRSIMKFHVMYQTKKILYQMRARNPKDDDFNPYNNPYDKNEYQKLLNEFNVRPRDVPEIDQPAGGLGFIRVSYGPSAKVYSHAEDLRHYNVNKNSKLATYPSTGKDKQYRDVQKQGERWGPGKFWQFPQWDGSAGTKMDSVTQDSFNYHRVIPDHGQVFTNPGIVRLNDSIRAYVYCLLGAQVQARQAGSSLEAQQEFLVLVNDLIAKKQTLEESISNFEDSLSKTRGIINYVVAKGLYMIPSDMNLNKLGQKVKGFNDQLEIADDLDGVGIKADPPKPKVKKVIPIPKPIPHETPKPIIHETLKPKLHETPKSIIHETPRLDKPPALPEYVASTERSKRDIHEGAKALISSGIIATGILYSFILN